MPVPEEKRSKRTRKKPVSRKPEGKSSDTRKREKPAEVEEPQAPRIEIPAFEGQQVFQDMDLPDPIRSALHSLRFVKTTPIQARLLPVALEGRDAAGRAQTGTGKTAAFLIAIYTHLLKKSSGKKRKAGYPFSLILAPTRELVIQIERDAIDIGKHTPFRVMAVYGGMDFEKQKKELLERPVDVVVATPGRLIDFMRRKVIDLSGVQILVIDEADRMLDMGFIPDVRRIVRATPHPEKRQTMFFSATLTPEIIRLAEQWTRRAEMIEIEPDRKAAANINQKILITTTAEKFALLYNVLKKDQAERAIVFCNRRDESERLTDRLKAYGFDCAMLSGAVPQEKRLKVLQRFKQGEIQVLVATDVAGRGLHIDNVSHVINYNLPQDPEDYVHRIGRTGRAGAVGTSVSFACEEDSFEIPDIEQYLGHPLACIHPDESLLEPPPQVEEPRPRTRRQRAPRDRGSGRRSPARQGSGRGRRGRR